MMRMRIKNKTMGLRMDRILMGAFGLLAATLSLGLPYSRAWGQEGEPVAEKGIIKDSHVRQVKVAFFGPDGLPHTVSIPKHMYKAAKKPGAVHTEAFDSSSIPGLGKTEKADMKAKTDPHSEVLIPKVSVINDGQDYTIDEAREGVVLCSVYEKDDAPSGKCARAQLIQKMQELADKHDAVFTVGIELEYFLFDASNSKENIPVDNAKYMTENNNPKVALYKEALGEVLKAMGIEYNKMHTEVAPSQEEIVLTHGPADQIADKLTLVKMVIKKLAPIFGFRPSFDPKPFLDQNGSGMHTHFSLISKDGKTNLCANYGKEAPNRFSELCNQFIAGVLKYGPSLAAITNPTPKSYLRIGDPEKEAPNKSAIGSNNRSCSIRDPLLGEEGKDYHPMETRAEYRTADPATNPYGHLFAMLSMGMKGIEEKLPTPTVIKDINIFDYVKKGPQGMIELEELLGFKIPTFPKTLEEAYANLVALRDGDVEVLPKEFLGAVISYFNRQMDEEHKKEKQVSFPQKNFDYTY